MPFIAILIGLLVGVLFYSGTTASYKKAGAGTTYRIESSTDVRLNRRLDNRAGTRSRVDHGFYSGSVSASGRSEAYRMPGSIKETINQVMQNAASVNHAAGKPGQGAQPRPQNNTRPQNNSHPQNRPRPPFGPMSRPGAGNRRDK